MDYLIERFSNMYCKMGCKDVRKSRLKTYINVSKIFYSSSIFNTKLCRIKKTECDDEIEHLFSMFHIPIFITILIQSRMKYGFQNALWIFIGFLNIELTIESKLGYHSISYCRYRCDMVHFKQSTCVVFARYITIQNIWGN